MNANQQTYNKLKAITTLGMETAIMLIYSVAEYDSLKHKPDGSVE